MLVLSRKVGEKIHIGDDIVITVVEMRGGRVRVGVDAPPAISVDRDEIRQAKLAKSQPVMQEEVC